MASDLIRILILSTIASSAAMLLALVLRKPMRAGFGARAAYALWILVPLSTLVFMLPAPVASLSMPVMPMAVAALARSVPAAVLPLENPFDPSLWLAGAWLLGAAIVFLLFAHQQRRFVRGLGQLSVANDETLRAQTTAGCPALLGAWHPRVVVPADFEQRYSFTERELILAHERTHRARGDAQINALAAVLRCAFWFNPLIHFVASRFRFDQELACDAVVISRFPEARRSYADAMLKTQLAVLGLPVGCHWQSSHPLKERIAMLKQPLPGRARAALGAGIAVALIIGGTYAAWAVQPPTPEAQSVAAKVAAPDANETKAGYRKLNRIAYPTDLIAAKTQGVVYVKVRIATDGSVTTAAVDRVDPPNAAALADAAVAGVKTWTFDPAQQQGKPVASDEIVPIVFALNDQALPAIAGATLDAIRISPPDADSTASKSIDTPPTEDVSFRRSDAPKYPKAAIDARQSGKLVLKVQVDEKGNVRYVEVEKADPPEAKAIFEETSVAAVMQWKFNPAKKNGKPVSGWVRVPIDFALTDDDS
jgi:TonB family protein